MRSLFLVLLTSLLFLAPDPVQAGSEDAKIVLHITPRDTPNTCTGATAPTSLACSGFTTQGQTGQAHTAYLVVANGDAVAGIAGLSCGLDYLGATGVGVDIFGWDLCADLEFPTGPIAWPEDGGGNQIAWDASGNCQRDLIPGFEGEGAHAIAGAFYIYAYTDDLLRVTANDQAGDYEIGVIACDNTWVSISTDNLGAARFTTGGLSAGYNPCVDTDPPPPPPFPHEASMMLHVGPVVPPRLACGSAPGIVEEVVTEASAAGDGSALYFVYVLGSPAFPGDPPGLTGFQLGIDYDEGTGPGDGLDVFSWAGCGDLEFQSGGWPASGSGNTITWSLSNCQPEEVVVAGYFYLSAYSPSVLSIVGWPATGLVKVGDCNGAETTPDLPLELTQVGWISLGGAARGTDTDGCNAALEPCEEPVPVHPTTWGRLKDHYRKGP